MSKYKVVIDGVEEDEIFDTLNEAKEAALYLMSCARLGAEILNMSNPGDYEYDEDEWEDESEYEILEIDDNGEEGYHSIF